jgi:DNA-binding HxlR family transcriptional regulator
MDIARETPVADALRSALSVVGDRWTLLIVLALADAPARFGELSDAVRGAAPNVLSARLRQLEADGLVTALAYSTRPVRLTYELTPVGHDLADVARGLAQWDAGRRARPAPLRHAVCDGPLRPVWRCEACETDVADAATEQLTVL